MDESTFYYNNGYLKLESLLSLSDINTLRKEICNMNKEGVKVIYENDGTTVRSLMSYHKSNSLLSKYTLYKPIVTLVEKLLSSKVYIQQTKINLKSGLTGKAWDYHRGFTFWNILDGIPKTNMVSVFICLTEQTQLNGAVFALVGSHKQFSKDLMKQETLVVSHSRNRDTSESLSLQLKREYLDKYRKDYDRLDFTCEPGDVFMMHPSLLHASSENSTQNSRDLMITVYNSVDNLPKFDTRPSYLCERDYTPI